MRIHVWVQVFQDRSTLQLQWMDAAGKRKTKSAKTADAAEAERARSDLEYELNHGLHVEPTRMSWQAFRETFEDEYLSAKRPNTQAGYKATFDLFELLCSPAGLASVTSRTASQFAAALRKRPGRSGDTTKPSTIAVRLEQLGCALSWAAKQGLMAKGVEMPAVSVPKKRPQAVPAESVERLLAKAKADKPMIAFILCGWLAGMRRNEAYALEWEQSETSPWLDFGRRRIVFPAESVKGKEDQWVPLDSRLQSAIEALPRHGAKVFAFRSVSGRLLAPQSVVGRLLQLAKRAGVRLTMRTLRRGFGCSLAGRVSAHVLQRLMRHADIEVTLGFYASFDPAIEEAIHGNRDSHRDSEAKTPAIPGE